MISIHQTGKSLLMYFRNRLLDIIIFENLDTVIMLAGYVLTAINKKKIEFDSSGAIIGELKK